MLTTWVNRQMLDNEAWRKASADLIQDPAVRASCPPSSSTSSTTNVDVASALQERLPPDLKPLAGTLSGALREPATEAVDRLLDAPRVQQLWIEASSTAQEKLVNVLENTTGAGISTGDGVVTLDLGELVQLLGEQLGLSASTLDRIPPDAGQVVVMRSDQLSAAQAGVQAVRVLSTWLLVLVLALYALAIFLARGARRETLRSVGGAFIIVGLAVLVVRRVAGNYAIDALTEPTSADSGRRVWLISTEILSQIGWAFVALRRRDRARRAARRSTSLGCRPARADRAHPERAPRGRLGGRRRRVPRADRLGADACAPHAVGDRPARRADRRRCRRLAPPDAA